MLFVLEKYIVLSFYGTDICFYDSDIFNIDSLNVDRKSGYTFYFSLCIQIFQI